MLKTKKTGSISLIVVIILSSVIGFMRITQPHNNYLSYDNFGYYMYLPALFIYDDIKIKDFSRVEELNQKYNCTPTFYQFDSGKEGNKVIRFFMGISIIYLPGFAAGHLIALNTDYPADGFSLPYYWGLMAWGLMFLIIGIFVLRKILLEFFTDIVTGLTLIFLFVGTNLFFFTTMGNDTPHVLLFTVTAIAIWFVMKWHQKKKTKYAIGSGFFIGLLIISRPSEITILFLFLLWGVMGWNSLKEKIALMFRHRKQLLWFALSGLIFAVLQMTYWKTATGNFVFFPYNDPGSAMDLSHPRIWWVLFSFRKGWFIYSPLMLCAMWGFYFMYKKNKEIFWAVFVVFLLNLYLISGFTSLISYGYRAFIQSYALLAIPLGYFIQYVISKKFWVRMLALIVFVLFASLNIFQSKQIAVGTIHGSRMTREYYFATFLKKYPSEEDRKLLLIERSQDGIDILKDEENYIKRKLGFEGYENPVQYKEKYFDTSNVYQGKYSIKLDSGYVYTPSIKATFDEITDDYYAWIRASVKFYPTADLSENEFYLVVTFDYKGTAHKWKSMCPNRMSETIRLNEWNTMTLDYLTPEMRSGDEKLSVYVWNPRSAPVYIDNLEVEVFERRR
ncbi:MAG: glycosyltransferase family 39 protein [Bacteroidales bacterium]|nr:glycosyltransferase family 39 protein [Bacteroidales bacterium]